MNDTSRRPVVGRLAPSPTGALHLGNARSFLLAWLSVRQQAGKILLRIEDIDSPRVKAWAVEQTIEDLRWLGLDWDNSELGLPDPLMQTPRLERYRQVFEELVEFGQIYPCSCSRKDVLEAASAPHDVDLPALEGEVYPGTCREKKAQFSELEKHSYRWKFTDSQEVTWTDNFAGMQTAEPAEQLGDFVIAKRDRREFSPAYQLAVVVDDHDQGVTEVVRGNDLIYSTYRQLAIVERLDWKSFDYFHVPLVVGPDGRRLAKRHGDTRLSHLRELGITAEAVVGFLAHSLGLMDRAEPTSADSLVGLLDWNRVPRQPTVFDLETQFATLQMLSK